MTTLDMKDLARRGAQVRITELQSELDAIFGAFPDLRRAGARKVVVNHEDQAQGQRRQSRGVRGAESARTGRKRRRMSDAQRKAVGVRMKKYWATTRAESSSKKR